MAYQCNDVKLDKGMYQEAGRTFTQVLERRTPASSIKAPLWRGWTPFSGS